MKKISQKVKLFNNDLSANLNFAANTNKTTNINILLNRVRNDRKKAIKKKIIFLSLLVSSVSIFAIFLNI
jgi:hypothetical protein